MSNFPEHDKLKAHSATSRVIGDFLEWMAENNLHLARSIGDEMRPYPMGASYITKKFLGIDLDKYEAENVAMLAHLETEEKRINSDHQSSRGSQRTSA